MVQPPWNTNELRWFCREPHAGLRQFFDRLSPEQVSHEKRIDDYLLNGREDLGVKMREGRLEIKTRGAILGRQRIGPVQGMLEAWTKRGFIPVKGAISPRDSGWVAVRKNRWATLYTPNGNGTEYQALSDTSPKGIQLEYTELNIGPDLWYTVGLEWPAEAEIPITNLPFASVMEDGNLDPGLSMSYPMFLKKLVDQTDL